MREIKNESEAQGRQRLPLARSCMQRVCWWPNRQRGCKISHAHLQLAALRMHALRLEAQSLADDLEQHLVRSAV